MTRRELLATMGAGFGAVGLQAALGAEIEVPAAPLSEVLASLARRLDQRLVHIGSVWYIGYSGIFLGEYYLATGDKRILPALTARCEALNTCTPSAFSTLRASSWSYSRATTRNSG